MMAKPKALFVADDRSPTAQAIDALEEARAMLPGQQRTEALKKAGLLRHAADGKRLICAKRGGPQK
jgi:hypothetical protein